MADAETLAALGMQVWLQTYATAGVSREIATYVLVEFGADRLRALVTDPAKAVLVAEVEGSGVAYAVVDWAATWRPDRAPAAELATLYVQEPFARRGIGSAMLRHAEGLARQRGATPLWLTVNVGNARAIAFYRSQGYRKVDTTFFELGGARHANDVLVGPVR